MNPESSTRRLALLAAPLLVLTLSACGGGGGQTKVATVSTTPRAVVRTPVVRPPRNPQIRMEPGLEGVIGGTRADLARQFGTPRLDVWEGDARKLQFTGVACVLDIYLYPQQPGAEPIATYVDARRSDGRDVDKANCVTALKR